MAKGTHSYVEDRRNENIIIYINGEFFPRNEAKISVFDSGFLLGDGVWEGIRLHNGKLCFIEEHIQRLYHGAEKLKIEIGMSEREVINLLYETLKVNEMHTDIHIRLIVSRGLKRTPYQHPNANVGGASIVIIPEYKKADSALLSKGIRLCLVDIVRGAQNSQDPRLNTLSKLNCIFGCLEADKKGFDEGIMLDMNDNVSTCNSTNFFIVKNGEVWTSTGETSQHKNRDKAMKVLRSRLYEVKMEKQHKERADARKSMVSTGDRSAKIRTYNFSQGRVTDHRINLTLYKLNEILDGDLSETIEALQLEDQKAALEAV